MVYLFGILGFFGGFAAGQLLLMRLLKGRSTQELLENRALKWTYGLLNWIIAALGAYSFIFLYNYYWG